MSLTLTSLLSVQHVFKSLTVGTLAAAELPVVLWERVLHAALPRGLFISDLPFLIQVA